MFSVVLIQLSNSLSWRRHFQIINDLINCRGCDIREGEASAAEGVFSVAQV